MSNPVVHSVHIYNGKTSLIGRLSVIVYSALKNGSPVLVVATPDHRKLLADELLSCGVDLAHHVQLDRFKMCDASDLLSTFMCGDAPDPVLFQHSIGGLLDEMDAVPSQNGRLMVFGEMVAVLWDEGKKDAALAVESLWNCVLHRRAFHLHCAYPSDAFINDDASHLTEICRAHSEVLNDVEPKDQKKRASA